MARSGIYKQDVINARNTLLAMGTTPTIDSIRIELGNTGSKSTIHRYLKEIDNEEGECTNEVGKVAVSEAILALSQRLAEQLQQDADDKITALTTRHHAEMTSLQDEMVRVKKELDQWREQAEVLTLELRTAETAHQTCQAQLLEQRLQGVQLAQRLQGLEAQQIKTEEYRLSLEEKHKQAREALEHFRTLAKEQREQERRQFEQQIQFLQHELRTTQETLHDKQQAVTVIQEDNIRLDNDLKLVRGEYLRTQQGLQALSHVEQALTVAELNNQQLLRQLTETSEREIQGLAAKQKETERLTTALAEVQRLDKELLIAKTALSVHERIIETLQPLFSKAGTSPTERHDQFSAVVVPESERSQDAS